ncbi:N-acetylglucosamine kinase [Sphingomonas aerophila]|uniref:N-acetylglucosamine kinase-like BadF-type ATPase n=1 Tax=Sphingomonas aerophila TaxID=1344948 RepID=A0A7W9BG55_9SPHN|nr:BadF/BadG/BcrA/BcrD ATPase family protein [Sphingomonas aerophila]MBB5716634.1 N-acetylglucosamine kinase-like BadF-type ATPase [Sphingomonas aerophila]
MSATPVFLGVDGGGTKTEFVCIDEEGRRRAAVKTGSTYHPEIGLPEVLRRLQEGVSAACAEAGVAPADLAYAFFGLPAFGEDMTIDPQLDAACGAMLGHRRYRCENDMVCGWAGSLGCEDGINIVAGTGSIGYGQHRGRAARAGGWGEVFSDEGSAYWIALRGLTIFSRMSDGRLPRGPLHERLRAELGLKHDIDLCQRIMGPPAMARADIAGLAPLVVAAADDGDEQALAVLDRAAAHLAAIAAAIREELGFAADQAVPLSWSGSILNNATRVYSRFVEIVGATGRFSPVTPRASPAQGAALYARKLAAESHVEISH